MRLLNVYTFELKQFNDNQLPVYLIASHRWCDNEATFADVLARRNTQTEGYQKVEAFCRFTRNNTNNIDWIWIDTCCIDKTNGMELQTAINSMFRWYAKAYACIVYLKDVRPHSEGSDLARQTDFEESEWHERGWCLQELLAPGPVVFLTRRWQILGHKRGDFFSNAGAGTKFRTRTLGPSLNNSLSRITGIPEGVLSNFAQGAAGVTPSEKKAWLV